MNGFRLGVFTGSASANPELDVESMKKIGLIINPVAGLGGKVGLKGTDGEAVLKKAYMMGALPEAPARTLKALTRLLPIRDQLLFLTCGGEMGERILKDLGFHFQCVFSPKKVTDALDTIAAASEMAAQHVELILFAGGDGTARNLCEAVGTDIPVIGIPAGVKIHSPVFGSTPAAAGELARVFLSEKKLPVIEEEVLDIDEEAYRNNQLRTSLYGYLKVPFQPVYLQNKKAPTPLRDADALQAIALDITDHMVRDCYYLIGPGSSLKAVMDTLELPCSLLGVDIIKNRELIESDCSEQEILRIIGDETARLILTPTGGQGYLFGRGNQQISASVLRKIGRENITIIATQGKIAALEGAPLLVDTGDEAMDQTLSGYYRVITGYGTYMMIRVSGDSADGGKK